MLIARPFLRGFHHATLHRAHRQSASADLERQRSAEAREALSTLLGDVAALSIRHASADEAVAWNASAMDARLDASSGHEPCPLLPPSMRNSEQLRATGRRQGN